MALITCIECGKQFSDKASACPECGCPTSECIATQEDTGNISSDLSDSVDIEESTEVSSLTYFSATKKIGPVQIDEKNCRFRIKGAISSNGKKTGLVGGTFKGLMAFSTLGMSVAAEKALGLGKQKVGSKDWFEFEDLINYDLIEDDSIVTSGGVGQALISGAVFGGLGAIAGGITAKRTQKRKVESLYIKITINSFKNPCVMIPLITKSTKTNSKEYQTSFQLAHQILAALDVITHNK